MYFFFSFLRYKLRLWIIDHCSFLKYVFYTTNFLLSTTFHSSHKIYKLYFIFIRFKVFFKISLETFSLLYYFKMYCLISKYLGTLELPSCCLFLIQLLCGMRIYFVWFLLLGLVSGELPSVSPGAGRWCWTCLNSRTSEIDARSLGISGEVGKLAARINSFLPQEEDESWDFPSVPSVLSRGKNLWHLPAQAISSALPWLLDYAGHVRSPTSKTKASPLGSPFEKVGVLDMWTNPFISLGEVGS